MISFTTIRHPRYKYRLTKGFRGELKDPWPVLKTNWINLRGYHITVYGDYCWDGPSGPAIDTANFLEASLVHDALYQAIALQIPKKPWKKRADQELKRYLKNAGMGKLRRQWVYWAVRVFGNAKDKYKP